MDMTNEAIEAFLLSARTKTYAGATAKAEAVLPGAVQYDYNDGDFSYRDTYYIGNGIFPGLETVFYKEKPVWSMSYFGDFSKMTEDQADTMLRRALIDLWQTTRMYNSVSKDYGDFRYLCEGNGSFEKLGGTEEIWVGDDKVFYFYYAGGLIG